MRAKDRGSRGMEGGRWRGEDGIWRRVPVGCHEVALIIHNGMRVVNLASMLPRRVALLVKASEG